MKLRLERLGPAKRSAPSVRAAESLTACNAAIAVGAAKSLGRSAADKLLRAHAGSGSVLGESAMAAPKTRGSHRRTEALAAFNIKPNTGWRTSFATRGKHSNLIEPLRSVLGAALHAAEKVRADRSEFNEAAEFFAASCSTCEQRKTDDRRSRHAHCNDESPSVRQTRAGPVAVTSKVKHARSMTSTAT